MQAATVTQSKRRYKIPGIVIIIVAIVVLGGIDVMFYFWPFRYRQVHPLLEHALQSRVSVRHFHRTYFPHPGFVAQEMTLYRPGVNGGAPLATVQNMTVIGTWSNLLFHPHLLHELRVEGLRVNVPTPGTKGGGINFAAEVFSPSQQKMQIQTIVANGTTLEIQRKGAVPLQLEFPSLTVSGIRHGRPVHVTLSCTTPGIRGMVISTAQLGPFVKQHYALTPLSGTWSLENGDLAQFHSVAGHLTASGRIAGKLSQLSFNGIAAIPDFRVSTAHTVPLRALYDVTVDATTGNVQIQRAQISINGNQLTASGSIGGHPRVIDLSFGTADSSLAGMLDVIEQRTPSVMGRVSFQAHAGFPVGPGIFLRKLQLQGRLALQNVHFIHPSTQDAMNAFSARVRRDPPLHKSRQTAADVAAEAVSDTHFQNGIAYFPDATITLPGAKAHLHGTFNLLDTRIHFIGTAALEQGFSHASTGWKAVLLAPLNPFFHHKRAPAVVPVAVTGTSKDPHIGADLFHKK